MPLLDDFVSYVQDLDSQIMEKVDKPGLSMYRDILRQPVVSFVELSDQMDNAMHGRSVDAVAVNNAMLDYGLLAAPVGMVATRAVPGKLLGSFAGKVGKMADDLPIPLGSPERAANFERWHGGNLLVDEAGAPIKWGHGTPVSGFTAFDISKAGNHTNAKDAKAAAGWVSDNLDGIASDYAYGRLGKDGFVDVVNEGAFMGDHAPGVIPGYVKAETPLHFDAEGGAYSSKLFNELVGRMKADGHDALVIQNIDDGLYGKALGTVVGFENPNQFKSVFNRGTFSRDEDDFMLSILPPLGLLDERK